MRVAPLLLVAAPAALAGALGMLALTGAGAAPPAPPPMMQVYDGPVSNCPSKPGPVTVFISACHGQECWENGGWVCHLSPDERPEVKARNAAAAAEQAAAHKRVVDAEVARLGGEYRRAEAERLVTMREQADAARRRANPGGRVSPVAGGGGARATAVAPAAPPTAAPAPQRPVPAFVRRPNLPETEAPAGFFDRNEFVLVDDPALARRTFEQMYGTCRGNIQYLTSGCYPDGAGRYNCQARVRCPLSGGSSPVTPK